MQPKADTVSKGCGFNQSVHVTAYARHSVTKSNVCLQNGLLVNDDELLQTRHFSHHKDTIRHPNSSFTTNKLYATSACGCKNKLVSDRRHISGTLTRQDGNTVGFIIFRV